MSSELDVLNNIVHVALTGTGGVFTSVPTTLVYAAGTIMDGATLPTEIGQLTSVEQLFLARNPGLTGPIPKEIGLMSSLNAIQMDQCSLTGPIPPELALLTNLNSLVLSQNQLTGAIPPELTELQKLQSLHLHTNQLSGPVPVFVLHPSAPMLDCYLLNTGGCAAEFCVPEQNCFDCYSDKLIYLPACKTTPFDVSQGCVAPSQCVVLQPTPRPPTEPPSVEVVGGNDGPTPEPTRFTFPPSNPFTPYPTANAPTPYPPPSMQPTPPPTNPGETWSPTLPPSPLVTDANEVVLGLERTFGPENPVPSPGGSLGPALAGVGVVVCLLLAGALAGLFVLRRGRQGHSRKGTGVIGLGLGDPTVRTRSGTRERRSASRRQSANNLSRASRRQSREVGLDLPRSRKSSFGAGPSASSPGAPEKPRPNLPLPPPKLEANPNPDLLVHHHPRKIGEAVAKRGMAGW